MQKSYFYFASLIKHWETVPTCLDLVNAYSSPRQLAGGRNRYDYVLAILGWNKWNKTLVLLHGEVYYGCLIRHKELENSVDLNLQV